MSRTGDDVTGHLPPRRDARAIDFELFDGYACQGYSAHFSEFAPGDLAEVFLRPVGGPNAKVGMPLDTMAKDLSVLFSIARRYGAPVAVIIQALSQEKGGMMLGPLGEFLRLHAALPPKRPDADPETQETPPGPPAGGSGGAAAEGPVPAGFDGSSAQIPSGVDPGALGLNGAAPGPASGRAVSLDPADPKELQNDGEPIAEALEIWPVCGACGARHSLHVHCASERRHTRVMQ